MGLVMEKSVIRQINDQAELEKLYLELVDRFEKHRIEIVNGRIVVREVATIAHADVVYQLMSQLMPFSMEKGWRVYPEARIFPQAQADRYEPDLIVVPANRRLWDPSHVYANATLLVAEVVSPSSVHDDHMVKPRNCALAGVPLYLVIDTFASRFRLLSRPGPEGYADEVTESLGKPLELPAPWNLTIDTAKLIEG
ncbi:Putative restriction endonuclease [Streptosporangium subroseum]|uniref:Putative restriction endonuclease n=1 Tax=Streptosporangium subroseum TaxID=106412 RepID=A0A239HAS5_9ACTN|nr:Uma2 family endonuclease [Streptosporangium subroseum]SNS78138.1 Putative restriction endonuclease [Streptosporangium subroseum]